MFKLNDRLHNDTIEICDLSLCKVLLMNDSNYPWLILVPQINDLTEFHHIPVERQMDVMNDISIASNVMEKLHQPVSLNVAALGNVVTQLHIHVVARFKEDATWPGPIWGQVPVKPYTEEEITKISQKLKKEFESLQK